MEEIKIGEYIRTKRGYIRKVIRRDSDKHILLDIGFEGTNYLTKIEEREVIVKHSQNIIDLIETGDVLKIKKDNSICYIGLEKDETIITYQEITDGIKNKKIELLAIATKEQFKQIEYKI